MSVDIGSDQHKRFRGSRLLLILEAESAPRRDTVDGIIPVCQRNHIDTEVIRWSTSHDKALQKEVATLKLQYSQLGALVRVNPSPTLVDFDEENFWNFVRTVSNHSTVRLSDADAMLTLANKTSLARIGHLFFGLRDTVSHRKPSELEISIQSSLQKGQVRVLKPSFGRCGAGVIIVAPAAADGTVETVDVVTGVKRQESLEALSARCFSSDGLEWIDMKFLPRISEGEVRLLMTGSTCFAVVTRSTPSGAFAAAAESKWEQCNSEEFDVLREHFLETLPELCQAVGLSGLSPLPPIWTADFIRDDEDGWVLGEMNAMAVGYTAFDTMEEFGNCIVAFVLSAFASQSPAQDFTS